TQSVPVELRMDGDVIKVSGYAAVFDEETDIGGMFREVIRPGAFKSAIERNDNVSFLINHDGLPLARTSSGTLKLTEDRTGLRIDTELDATDPDVARIVPKMKRGDLDKMSFAFISTREEWTFEDGESDLREVMDTELFDVSIVTDPAYGGTSIALRSRDDAKPKPKDEEKPEASKKADSYFLRKASAENKFRGI
ncbi:MAG: HK97 family phage prohead protease, partial [Marinomonas sp.]